MAKRNQGIEAQVGQLESGSVQVMLDYLQTVAPTELQIEKARLGLGAFANVQRRMSAQNQRAALEMMARREGLIAPSALPDGR